MVGVPFTEVANGFVGSGFKANISRKVVIFPTDTALYAITSNAEGGWGRGRGWGGNKRELKTTLLSVNPRRCE